MNLDRITQPTLLLDPYRCKANIRKMTEKAVEHGFELRPHFKTHQSHIVGSWFREEGVSKITVSSVGMATFFAINGWDDITIAFPVNIRQIEEIKEISERIKLGLLVLDPGTVDILGKELTGDIFIWIKIDVGTHRTGIRPEDTTLIDRIFEKLSLYPQLHFAGFLGH